MFTFTMPKKETPQTKAFHGHLACSPREPWLNRTIIQIRQLKRNYLRRL